MKTMTSAALAILFVSAASVGCGGAGGGEGAKSAEGGAKHALQDNPAPPLSGESVNGMGKIDIAQWKGKVVVVDFWATWCEPCKKSFPQLEALRVKYSASGLEMVGVSEDDDDSGVKAFGERYGAKFPLVWDKDKAAGTKWDPSTMPTSFVVDKEGVIRFVHIGYHDGEAEALDAEVKSLL